MSRKYKILFITSTLDIRGRHSHLLSLCRVLLQRGHKVEVIAKEGNMVAQFQQEGIPLHLFNLTTLWWKDFFYFYDFYQLTQNLAPDFVHIVAEEMFWAGPWLSRLIPIPYFLTVNHFFNSAEQIPIGTTCKGIISVSQALREHLVNQLNLPNRLLKVIPNGIDIFRFRMPKKRPQNVSKIITVMSRFETRYGVETFIQAVAKVREKQKQFYGILIGEGPEEMSLRELSRKLSLETHLVFSAPRLEYEHILQMSDVYVTPSLSEGLGQTTMEAMSCGVPVVATKVGGIFTAVQDHETGILVPKSDPQVMAEAILEILLDTELSGTLGKNARNLIQTQFNLAQMVDTFEEFYEEKLNS